MDDGGAFELIIWGGLEWFYDKVEDRYGRVAAWLATLTLGLVEVGILVGIIIVAVRR